MKCPYCNSAMVLRNGKRGKFYGCTRYSQGCRGTRNYVEAVYNPNYNPPGSPEQLSIWDFLANGTENGMIEALAGTGKTYTITNGVYKLQHLNIAVFSFNTHIIVEMNEQLAKKGITWVTGTTYNSFGNRAYLKAFPDATLVKDKVSSILWEIFKSQDDDAMVIANAAEKLVRLCKCYLENGYDQEVLTELIDRFNVDMGDGTIEEVETRTMKVMELVPLVLNGCRNNTSMYDFDDQVWLTVELNLPVQKFDLVLVDEAQDTNYMNQMLISMVA